MPPSKKIASARKAAKLRSWRVEILRNPPKPLQYLGDVQAANERAAEAAAITQFKLSEEQRKRLVVRER
jgi:hypothetical protein